MSHTFSDLGLSSELIHTLSGLGLETPTEVQQHAIPHVLRHSDVLAGAQTGTGKTAAYGLPIIDQLSTSPQTGETRALILVPTRELAQQVFDNLTSYAQHTQLNIVVVYGGVSIKKQTEQLKAGADIVIATPGRLLDHLFNKHVSLNAVGCVVFDEADRMLDMGFMPDIQRITKRLPQTRQTLFFSATFETRVKTMAYRLLNDPVEVQVTPQNSTAETVIQMVYPVDKHRKSELLAYLIGANNWQQVLVFTKTKQGSDALAKELKLDGIKAASINGDKSQGARQKALDDFKSGKVRALIATDVAARGLDIQQLEQVVNYDMPYKAEDYIHRIGRTGRAGQAGHAISFMSREEQRLLEAIEVLLDTRLPQEWLAGFEPGQVNVELENHRRQSRSSEKRKLKARLGVHKGRGKKKR